MPNRIIKESICASDTIDQLSWFEESFFYRLIVNCDDYGRMDARTAILKARMFPLKEISEEQIKATLFKLSDVGILLLYECDGRPYLQLSTWEKHQQIRAKKSKYPAFDSACKLMISDDIKCPRNPIQSNPNPIQSESNTGTAQISSKSEKPKKEKKTKHTFTPPTREEVRAYAKTRGNKADPDKFYDYYTADPDRQWIDKNGTAVSSWKQKFITWEGRDANNQRNNNSTVKPVDTGRFENLTGGTRL